MSGRRFRATVSEEREEIPEVTATRVCRHPAGHYDKKGNMICDVCGETIGTRREGRFAEVRAMPEVNAIPLPEVTATKACRHNNIISRGDGTFYCNQCRQNLAIREGRYVPLSTVRAIPLPEVEARAVGGTLKWLGNSVKENVKTKTLESLALVIGAVILVSFGFIFAAVGLIFFLAFIYLPSEADVMARAREQAGHLPVNVSRQILFVRNEITKVKEDIAVAGTLEEKRELTKKLKSLQDKEESLKEKAVGFGVDLERVEETAR